MNSSRSAKYPNMDVVRYILALGVLVAHFNYVYGTDYFWPLSSYNAVGGFFALSGFLIYKGYAAKRNLRQYVVRRAKRIYPPYLLIVGLSAFGLVAVSSLPAAEYFGSGQFWRYLAANLTFMNFLGPSLPGVFGGEAVNGSLWTIKIEWMLYLSVPMVVWLVNRLKGRRDAVMAVIYVASIAYRITFALLYERTGSEICNILSRQVFGQLMYFYAGAYIYFHLDSVMRRRWLLVGLSLAVMLLEPYVPYLRMTLSPAALALLVLIFSLTGSWGSWGNSVNNLSYDIYLFHMPVFQLVATVMPGLQPAAAFVLSLAAIVGLSALSWFGIERRILYPDRKPSPAT